MYLLQNPIKNGTVVEPIKSELIGTNMALNNAIVSITEHIGLFTNLTA